MYEYRRGEKCIYMFRPQNIHMNMAKSMYEYRRGGKCIYMFRLQNIHLNMAKSMYEYRRGGKCIYMFIYTYVGSREMKMWMEKEFRHIRRFVRTSTSTVT